MRAYSWFALGAVAFACGGSAFTTSEEGGAGGSNDMGGTEGNAAGSPDQGGTSSRAGTSSGGGGPGAAGEGGSAGEVTSGGTASGGTDTAGTSTGGMSGGGNGGTAGSGGTAGTGGVPPVDTACPKTQPTNGSACVGSAMCSFGTDVRTSCRNTTKCVNGAWALTKPNCESLSACEDVQEGAACQATSKPCLLSVDKGIYCVCTACGNGGPCGNQAKWVCAGSNSNGCPVYAPNLGASCTNEQTCSYGSCGTSNGVNAVCENSTWSWHGVICPL